MSRCCIIGCKSIYSKNDEGLSFFRFPRRKTLRELWIKKIGSKNIKSAKVMKICSKHFVESSINKTLGVVRLKDDVVPTLFPFTSSVPPDRRRTLSINIDNTGNITDLLKPSTSRSCPLPNNELVSSDTRQKNTIYLPPCNPLPLDIVYINPICTRQLEARSMDVVMSANTGESRIFTSPVPPIVTLLMNIDNTGKITNLLKPTTSRSYSIPNNELVSSDTRQKNTTCLLPCNPLPTDKVDTNPVCTRQLQARSMDVVLSAHTRESFIDFADKKVMNSQKLAEKIESQKKKIKMLNQKCRRLKSKVCTYKNIIEELRN